ncbi:MAG: hypothetical protein V1856_02630 [Candidatus Liptonbacteria bacterium]
MPRRKLPANNSHRGESGLFGFFDRLEDDVRAWFSRHPILYGFMGGVGVVLFWRGVWHTTDWLAEILINIRMGNASLDMATFPDGPLSFLFGTILLLVSGLFVSNFVGNQIIISGLRGEKKIEEKTESEVRAEKAGIVQIKEKLAQISERLDKIEGKL